MNQIAARRAPPAHDRAVIGKLRGGSRLAAALATLSLGALTACESAVAATTVEVLDTEPASRTVRLASGQTFYMRIAYSTDTPVRIWARPYFAGREADAGSNPSRVHTGDGEALAWFFFPAKPGQRVDEIRIFAGDGSTSATHELERLPVNITAGAEPALATAEPAWLARLKAEEQRLQQEDYERRMSEPLTAGDQAFAAGFMLAVLAIAIGGVALPIRAMRRWQGGWRLAAALPALWVGIVVLRVALGTALDPTSHNLWPFEILQASVLSLALIGALTVARRVARR